MTASNEGGEACACAFMALANQAAMKREVYGVGMDANIITASLQALISGVNRLLSD
jgi:2-isopropylmalate synthase